MLCAESGVGAARALLASCGQCARTVSRDSRSLCCGLTFSVVPILSYPILDPGGCGLQLGNHPAVPESHRTVAKWTQATHCSSRRNRLKDACWSPKDQEQMMHRFDNDEL